MFFSEENKNNGNQSPRNRNLHPTYFNKPKPALQMMSQNAVLDDRGRATNAYRNPGNPEDIPAVPTTWDTVYDPQNPEADWTGLVKKEPHKKHAHDHVAMREGIERNEYGIISKEERQEWGHKRTNNDPAHGKNSASVVLGGIDNPDDRYVTTYKRFEAHENTARDQLTLDKRANPMKRIQDPGQSLTLTQQQQHYPTQQQFHNSSTASVIRKDGLINPRASLLSGIGAKVLQNKSVPPPTFRR
jgi:hypothetical protein